MAILFLCCGITWSKFKATSLPFSVKYFFSSSSSNVNPLKWLGTKSSPLNPDVIVASESCGFRQEILRMSLGSVAVDVVLMITSFLISRVERYDLMNSCWRD